MKKVYFIVVPSIIALFAYVVQALPFDDYSDSLSPNSAIPNRVASDLPSLTPGHDESATETSLSSFPTNGEWESYSPGSAAQSKIAGFPFYQEAISDVTESPIAEIDMHVQLMRWQRFIDGIRLQPEQRQFVSLILKNAEAANASLYGRVVERSLSKEAFAALRADLVSRTETELKTWLDDNALSEFRRVWQDNSAQYPSSFSTRLDYSIAADIARLFELATAGSQDELGSFLSEAKVDVNSIDPRNGSNALIKASYAGKTENVVTLLRHGALPDTRTQYGRTALLNAVGNGHDATVALLLAAGANPLQRDNLGMSPLTVADMYKPMNEKYENIAAMLREAIETRKNGLTRQVSLQ